MSLTLLSLLAHTFPNSTLAQQERTPFASLHDVFNSAIGSVVQVTATTSKSVGHITIKGVPLTRNSTIVGSGFIYDKQAHIITNNHVIESASKVHVTFRDGNTYSAIPVGRDIYEDLAVLKITEDFSEEKVIPLPFANSSDVGVADQVLAIGNPFGLSGTATSGIVSQIGRLLPNTDTGSSTADTIQTDTALDRGNSGGPLLNTKGEVIGMNTAITSLNGVNSGVGFAIPSNAIVREVPLLIKNGTYIHPWLGIAGGKITPAITKSAGLPANYKGVVVGSVQSGSPADKAGLQATTQDMSGSNTHIGDIITAIDGHPTRQIDDIINYIESHKKVGDNIKLTVNRSGKVMDLTVTLQLY